MVKIQKLDDVIKMQLGASLDDINILFEAAYARPLGAFPCKRCGQQAGLTNISTP